MSLDALKREAAALDDDARRELFSFLVTLREKQWVAQAEAMSRHLDDPNPDRWVTLDEFQRRLDQIPEPPGE